MAGDADKKKKLLFCCSDDKMVKGVDTKFEIKLSHGCHLPVTSAVLHKSKSAQDSHPLPSCGLACSNLFCVFPQKLVTASTQPRLKRAGHLRPARGLVSEAGPERHWRSQRRRPTARFGLQAGWKAARHAGRRRGPHTLNARP